jgi:broad specificity phosphatase PhoE
MSGADGHAEREIVLVRHAETEWSRSGRHTGLTDLPLTERGRAVARSLAPRLERRRFALVLTSPSRRARETCELCGLGKDAVVCDDLHEWDYGDYEGLTSAEILAGRPGWSLWRDGCPGGESPDQVGARADRLVGELRGLDGDAVAFSHGHMLRVLGVRWSELPVADGAHLLLSPAAVSALGYERAVPAIARWNEAA